MFCFIFDWNSWISMNAPQKTATAIEAKMTYWIICSPKSCNHSLSFAWAIASASSGRAIALASRAHNKSIKMRLVRGDWSLGSPQTKANRSQPCLEHCFVITPTGNPDRRRETNQQWMTNLSLAGARRAAFLFPNLPIRWTNLHICHEERKSASAWNGERINWIDSRKSFS